MNYRDRFLLWLVYRLPARLIMWATVRVAAYGTTGKYSNQNVPELTIMDALKRYEQESG